MNKVILIGRLTRDPELRETQTTSVCRYTLAVDRRFKRDGEPTADFISCVVFGKPAEFASKYFKKGLKVSVVGNLRTGSYTDNEGVKKYTTDVVVEEQYFVESKAESDNFNKNNFDSPTPSMSTKSNNNNSDNFEDFSKVSEPVEDDLPF